MKRSIRCLTLSIALLSSSLAYAHGQDRPLLNAYLDAPAAASPARATRKGPPSAVTSMDAKRGVPSFLWAAKGASAKPAASLVGVSPAQAAALFLAQHADTYGVTSAALAAAKVVHVHDTGRGGIIVTLRQEIGGVELFYSDIKVMMTRSLELVAISGAPHHDGVPGTKGRRWSLSAEKAIATAFSDLYGITVPPSAMSDQKVVKGGYRYFDLKPTKEVEAEYLHFSEPARVKKVYFPLPDRVVPAYFVELDAGRTYATSSDLYHYVVAADDGRLLYRQNRKFSDSFNYKVWADKSGDLRPLDGPHADWTPHPTGAPDGSFPAFLPPVMVSMEGFNKNPNNAVDPWLAAGATETNGNNVDAYADVANPNGFSGGDLRASTTSASTFDRTYDTALSANASPNQRMAAVTQLFYVNNWLHDWWYDSGFNEGAQNAQKSNFGRGGVEGDALLAEAQDYSGTNNANMDAAADGKSPRMQMYVWDGVGNESLGVQPLNVNLATGAAEFGAANFNQSGQLILANDGMNPTADACTQITNNVAGKIVLIDRGTCTFTFKSANAESQGAIGVIIANNVANAGPMGMQNQPADGTVTIPVMSISLEDGSALKAAMMNGAQTATMTRVSGVTRDGTIDNMIVAHEWGHYIHLRQVACGSQQCGGQSEGWGDYTALNMAIREGDNLDGTFGAAVYAPVLLGDSGYYGIRRVPYSTDMNKNALTFKHIGNGVALPANHPISDAGAPNNNEVHNVGEVWATMAFEAHMALLKETQVPNATRTFAEARRVMSDYIEGGYQMAPPSPTFTEQRDAILAAAAAADKNDFITIAKAFAKRGAGTCAESPPSDSQGLTEVVEDFEIRPALALVSVTADDSVKSCDSDGLLDGEEIGKATVEIMNSGTATLKGTTGTIATTTAGVTFPAGTTLTIPDIEPFATAKVSVDIAMDATVLSIQDVALTVTLNNATACKPTLTDTSTRAGNADNTPSKLDTVESDAPSWTRTGDAADQIWARELAGSNHVWAGADYGSVSDTALESPDITVSAAASFIISFEHSHQFESSQGVDWDGAVIEISEDGGKNWADISAYVNPGYNGTVGDPQQNANNPLQGREAFVAQNPSYPAMDKVTLDLGTKVAGKTVRIRFRAGSDEAQGDVGWKLDNISFDGIDNAPFSTLTDDAATCAGAPVADAGPDQTVASASAVKLDASKSSDPDNDPLTFAWIQTGGPAVKLSDASIAAPDFTAPSVTESTTLTFKVNVSDGKATASDSVDIIVTPAVESGSSSGTGPSLNLDDDSGCGCAVIGDPATSALAPLAGLGLLALFARRRRSR